MPAARTCHVCEAPLPPSIRWCGRCYEPVRELTPRAPIHAGDFVGVPRHRKGAVPHWSRSGKDPTTFGLAGRIGITTIIVVYLVTGLLWQFILFWAMQAVVATYVLADVWRPAWVVPDPSGSEKNPGRRADPQA